jgi:tetratricopeptide (TPR) repeat protein
VIVERPGPEARYRLLETVRQYGRDRLQEAGEDRDARDRHRDWFLGFAEQAELDGDAAGSWLDCLETEHDNLRAALDWALERGDTESGLRLSGALARFWRVRGHIAEGRERITRMLALPAAENRTAARAKALLWAARFIWMQENYGKNGLSQCQESLSIARHLGDPRATADALAFMGWMALDDDPKGAAPLFEESLALRRAIGDPGEIARSLNDLGSLAYRRGEFDLAHHYYTECVSLHQQSGRTAAVVNGLLNLGLVTLPKGEYEASERCFAAGLQVARELGDGEHASEALKSLGLLAYHRADFAAARACWEEQLHLLEERKDLPGVADALASLGQVARRLGEDAAARRLGEESLAMARATGQTGAIEHASRALAATLSEQGASDLAEALYRTSIRLLRGCFEPHPRRKFGPRHWITECFEGLAPLLLARGWGEPAARLLGAAEGIRQGMQYPVLEVDRPEYDRSIAAVRAALGDEAFAAAWAEGRAMSLDEAVTCALASGEGSLDDAE